MSKPQGDLFEIVENLALSREEVPADQVPAGVPSDELERIQKWRASNHSALAAKAQGQAGEIELSIIGVIGGGWFGDGISARSVKYVLDANKEAKSIRVLVDSPGGDYFDGAAIMNQLKRHAARVTVEVIGEASSAGSVIAMAGDDVEMHAGSVMMVHRAWTCACGNGDALRTAATMLDKIDDALGEIYSSRTGKTREEVDTLVAATTYMSAKEAVESGFADRVVPAKQKPKSAPANRGPGAARAQAKTPPSPEAREQEPPRNLGEETNSMALSKIITTALALSDDADETAAVAAINKLKTSATIGGEIEQLLGQNGRAAVGAVKALKDAQAAHVELEADVAKLKIVNARRDFESVRDQGLKDRKLVPATAKYETERFEKALGDETLSPDARAAKAEEIAQELKGRLAIAPRITAANLSAPGPVTGGGESGPLQHNGKTFEAMSGAERHRLKGENPELYETLREDAVARGAV